VSVRPVPVLGNFRDFDWETRAKTLLLFKNNIKLNGTTKKFTKKFFFAMKTAILRYFVKKKDIPGCNA
jgi:hypothetical protein